MMNPKIKKLWVAALRSGKYRKTDGVMRRRSGKKVLYCVLGVLCELHRLATEEGEWIEEDGILYYSVGKSKSAIELPNAVCRWAGFKSKSPRIPGPDGKLASMLEMNDDTYLTFKHIAGFLEASSL